MFKGCSSTLRGPQCSGAPRAPPEDVTMTRQTTRHPAHATLPSAWGNVCGTVSRLSSYGEAVLVRPGRRWMSAWQCRPMDTRPGADVGVRRPPSEPVRGCRRIESDRVSGIAPPPLVTHRHLACLPFWGGEIQRDLPWRSSYIAHILI